MSGLNQVWLVSDGRVLASALLATTRTDRRRGLIGESTVSEPLVLEPCNWIHTLGMHTSIDVAYVDANNLVIGISTMKPWRIGPYTRQAVRVIEASAGSLERWNVRIGSTVEVRHVEH
jgi:uncharacterized membrane protein (UPF0127 family)